MFDVSTLLCNLIRYPVKIFLPRKAFTASQSFILIVNCFVIKSIFIYL